VVIGFATSAGDTADDGNGDMSPYAKALSKRLKTPNKDITKVLGLVALDVSAKYNQNPIYRANLAYDVILNKKVSKKITKHEKDEGDTYLQQLAELSREIDEE
jgi:hypothetical protein